MRTTIIASLVALLAFSTTAFGAVTSAEIYESTVGTVPDTDGTYIVWYDFDQSAGGFATGQTPASIQYYNVSTGASGNVPMAGGKAAIKGLNVRNGIVSWVEPQGGAYVINSYEFATGVSTMAVASNVPIAGFMANGYGDYVYNSPEANANEYLYVAKGAGKSQDISDVVGVTLGESERITAVAMVGKSVLGYTVENWASGVGQITDGKMHFKNVDTGETWSHTLPSHVDDAIWVAKAFDGPNKIIVTGFDYQTDSLGNISVATQGTYIMDIHSGALTELDNDKTRTDNASQYVWEIWDAATKHTRHYYEDIESGKSCEIKQSDVMVQLDVETFSVAAGGVFVWRAPAAFDDVKELYFTTVSCGGAETPVETPAETPTQTPTETPTETETPAQSLDSQVLLKVSGKSSLYYLAKDGKRYVFPHVNVFNTWKGVLPSQIKFVTAEKLASYRIGGNVTNRPGARMVKITTDPKVYAVGPNGTLRWVKTEEVAIALYGANWGSMVDDVADAFFTNYSLGDTIESASDFNPSDWNSGYSLDQDLGL